MQPRMLTIILSFLVLLIWQNNVFANEIYQTKNDDFLKKVFTTKDGLPQNSPSAIVQTKDDYIWIATFGGLARFDGIEFKVYDTSNTPELKSNRITALYEDHNGILWIGSEEGDIVNYQNGSFTTVRKSAGSPIDDTIWALYVDQNNILWIGTKRQIKTYSIDTGEFFSYSPDGILKEPIPPSELFTITTFLKDSNGYLWMATNGGLIRLRDGEFTNFNTDDGLPDRHITSIEENPNGGLWIKTDLNVGIYKDKKFTEITPVDNIEAFSLLTVNKNKHLLFVTTNFLFDVDASGYQTRHDLNIGADGIKPIFFDKQGNLWVGSNIGLVRFQPRRIKVFAKTLSPEEKIWRGISAIRELPDKSMLAIGKHFALNYKNNSFQSLPMKEPINFFSFDIDKNNVIWAGAQQGLFKIENNQITHVSLPETHVPLPTSMEISPVMSDRKGTLWFGERVGGLYQYQDGILKQYTVESGLANNWISYIFEDSKGVMWFGTKGGLSRLENGEFTNFTTNNGLANNNVRDIYEDSEGVFWIGTYGGGISRLKDGQIVSITTNEGLAENIASRLILDDYGFFWILGNQGIYTVSKTSLNELADGKTKRVYCTIYDERDGMAVGEGSGGNQPAGWKASDNRIWFPMIRGGIIIDPIKPNLTPVPVYIEDVLLNKNKTDSKGKLEILPNQDNLEIKYTAVSFDKPEQIQFRYKLDGYDNDWQDVGFRRTAYYPYIPPGNYKFRVMATNGNDIWSENDASLEIVVHAPFWRTWWFFLIVFLALILLIVIAYQSRFAIVQQRRLQQEVFSRQLINAHESERNRIAGELHDGLGQNLLVIKNWSLLILKQIPAKSKYRRQLEEITEIASQSLEETRTISQNLRPQNLRRFGLTKTIINMVRQVEESTNIKCQTDIEDIDEIFNKEEEELSIYRIVQECLNNVVKHSEATKVTVKVLRLFGKIEFTNSQDRVLIEIIDNGKGFNLPTKNKPSFGLDNINQRVQLLGGKYSIRSEIGKGTHINISLNLPEIKHEE